MDYERDENGFIVLRPRNDLISMQLKRTSKKEIVFRHGHIAITDYHMGDNPSFEKFLSVWDGIYYKWNLLGGFYIPELCEFRINRGFDPLRLHQYFPNHTVRVDNHAYPSDKIKVKLYAPPRNDFQKVALTFMACQGIYRSNLKYTQQLIDADTGDGKTYCGVATSSFLSSRVVIIVPFTKLLQQWKESFINFTSIKEDEIMIVQGGKACDKIVNGKCKKKKVFLFMVNTIYAYQKSHGNIKTIEMLMATNAYTKIVDEIHRDMKSISMIEALCNFRMNYYMSASPGRSDRFEDRIFNVLYRDIPRFGSKFKKQEEKHINIMIKQYRFIPTSEQMRVMFNPKRGLNTMAYEKTLVEAPRMQNEDFEIALLTMFNWSKQLLKKGNKILILCKTVTGAKYVRSVASRIFGEEHCSAYYSTGMSKAEKEEALTKDIISATEGSLGTGADIKGIQHVYNIMTYSNKIGAMQYPGRGRKLDDGTPVIYVEFLNVGYNKTVNHFENRKYYLKKKSCTGKLIMVE